MMFGIASTALMMVPLVFVSGLLPSLVVFFLLGITTGAVWIVGPVFSAEAVGVESRGAAIGTYRTFFDLGSIFGPIIMIWVQETRGASWTFYLSSIILVIALIPSIMAGETKPSVKKLEN